MALADLYFPNTRMGRDEAMRLYPKPSQISDTTFAFCNEYRPEKYVDPLRWRFCPPRENANEPPCSARDPRYLGGRNKCRRCPAGFSHECAVGLMPEEEMR